MRDWILPDGLTYSDMGDFAAFVYIITNLETGQKYIGRKNIWVLQRGKRVHAAWKNYFGSSNHLKADIALRGRDAFERRIIHLCGSRRRADFLEIEELFKASALRAKLPEGSPAFYNRTIAGKWFGEPDDTPEVIQHRTLTKPRKTRDADPSRRRWKLTDAEIDRIRASTKSAIAVAADFGISRQAVYAIRKGLIRP